MQIITKICPISGQEHGMEFGDYDAGLIGIWEKARAEGRPHAHVQDAFPHLTADEREFILTGAHPKAFDDLFAGEED